MIALSILGMVAAWIFGVALLDTLMGGRFRDEPREDYKYTMWLERQQRMLEQEDEQK